MIQSQFLPSADAHYSEHAPSPVKPLEDALNAIFPTAQFDNRIQQARRIMGDEVDGASDQELANYLSQLEFLMDSWLDDFERQVFDGKTLSKVMQGG